MSKAYEAGDKVFVISEQRLATVLNTYGDGVNGYHGDMRLDLCGNTSTDDFEHYDPVKHAAFDSTFMPIMLAWKLNYGITKDIPVRLGKVFRLSENIGKAKYVVSFHDGVKTHADGSPFFDMEILTSKRKRDQLVKKLKADGYIDSTGYAMPIESKDPNESGTALEVVQGIARAFYLTAYARAWEEADESNERKRAIGSIAGRNWDDIAPKETDPNAVRSAYEVSKVVQRDNGVSDMAELYHAAMEVREMGAGDRMATPDNFGFYLAMDAMGEGVGLADAFGDAVKEFVKLTDWEFSFFDLEKDYF